MICGICTVVYLWFAVLLEPTEDAGRQLGKVSDGDRSVKRLEEGIHDLLELNGKHNVNNNGLKPDHPPFDWPINCVILNHF